LNFLYSSPKKSISFSSSYAILSLKKFQTTTVYIGRINGNDKTEGGGIRNQTNGITENHLSGYAPRKPPSITWMSCITVDAMSDKGVRFFLLFCNHVYHVNYTVNMGNKIKLNKF
jgi:hypothetical protein